MTDLERVNYQGGPLHGAILEMSAGLAARVTDMKLVITAGGKVFDRSRQVGMPTIRVVQGPQPLRPEPVTSPKRKRAPRRKTT